MPWTMPRFFHHPKNLGEQLHALTEPQQGMVVIDVAECAVGQQFFSRAGTWRQGTGFHGAQCPIMNFMTATRRLTEIISRFLEPSVKNKRVQLGERRLGERYNGYGALLLLMKQIINLAV